MNNEMLVYSSLVFSMALGGTIVVAGFFIQGGPGWMTVLGSAFILLCVGGLAYLANQPVAEDTVTFTTAETANEDSEPTHESNTH